MLARTLTAPARSWEQRMKARAIRTGMSAGLFGGVCIWLYEALVWAGVQHLMPIRAIPGNATGLVFGKAARQALRIWADGLGVIIHFGFAAAWGVAFALPWPRPTPARIRSHPAGSALAGHEHSDYLDPQVIIGGVFSHLFDTVPMALWVKSQPA